MILFINFLLDQQIHQTFQFYQHLQMLNQRFCLLSLSNYKIKLFILYIKLIKVQTMWFKRKIILNQ
jgi:hypothetical protein